MERSRFDGWIAGVGTSTGLRCVVGHWADSPLGPFTDVMVEQSDGLRVLLAPSSAVADFVAATYRFDDVRLVDIAMTRTPERWTLRAGPLALTAEVGSRGPLGYLLRAVPRPLATAPAWISAIDHVARRVLPGVRTVGTAGNGRREYYAALDLHRITGADVRWNGEDQGVLADVDPPVRFGFGSTPKRPSVARVVTLVHTT
ncbi:hypothetical protein [Pseudonocardia spinosispora]|uniref:hypothetical protein n=1 Tax=Pseudonocardia spinosispora TaxID=103441 RepID=UPI00040773D2|nr:hypothetical protein [Pseudonocardia spinosispora]